MLTGKLLVPAAVLALALLHAQEPPRASYPKGYLSHIDSKALLALIAPPPSTGDARDVADQEIFLATRQFKDSPRWVLATRDADLSVAGLMRAFGCTFGATTPAAQPDLARLLGRVASDSFALFGSMKSNYKRKRPFLIHDGPICVDRAEIAKSFDFPSAHSILGSATGFILAELDPQNAPAILGRAREFGESRIFCGVHNASAVEAGRILGAALFAMLQSDPDFQKDLAAARLELKTPHAPATAACQADAATLSQSPYSGLPSQTAPAP